MVRSRFAVVALAALVSLVGCTSPERDTLVRPPGAGDAAVDASDDASARDAAASEDASKLGAPCTDDPQCDDAIPCTFDACDPAHHRCQNTPDDSLCDDGHYCNGHERCVPAHGCGPGPVVTCEDGDACTIDRCIDATKSCEHATRDADGDGDPDDHCVAKRDCDDLDPTIASTHPEVCGNGKDDNCDGQIDEAPCVSPANDTCATAFAVTAPGTYALSSLGAKRDYATSCSVGNSSAAEDVVVAITVPAGGAKDVEVWATVPSGEVAVALEAACGVATSELSCGAGAQASSVRARGRSLSPGTYYAVVTTQTPGAIELQVDLLEPTAKPTNESCAAPETIALETATTVSIADAAKDLASNCVAATGELTYAFTLAQPADVRVFASTLKGSGAPIIGLRSAHCQDATDELRCTVAGTRPLFARSLAAGTWIVTVAASSPIDASVLVKTYPPTVAPPNQTCAAPPAMPLGTIMDVDLSNQEEAIKDGCLPGTPDAAYDLSLAKASDVLVVGRFPQIEVGAVSIDAPACGVSDVIVCGTGPTPVRVSKRALGPGDYRIVIADMNGAQNKLAAYVRDTVPPTAVSGGDSCASPVIDIPAEGGFFTGDTTTMNADFDDACDTPTQPGGANDQLLRLVLAQPEHVILNMDGSTYTTILDVRKGAACPGAEVPGACYVGFSGPRSFLDLNLTAGTYWIVIDGFAGGKGLWSLDVRVLPP